jgi:hypothetical protein
MRATPLVSARLFAALAAILILCSCTPATYPPPAQAVLPSGPEPPFTPDPAAGLIVAMSDPDADAHILADVFPSDPGSEWRFTGLHPRFRLDVQHASPLYFYLHFSNLDEMLRARGPVTFAIAIDGKRLQAPTFKVSGDLEYRWPVADGWVPNRGSVEISIDISPPWIPSDGTPRGTFLNTVGFEER